MKILILLVSNLDNCAYLFVAYRSKLRRSCDISNDHEIRSWMSVCCRLGAEEAVGCGCKCGSWRRGADDGIRFCGHDRENFGEESALSIVRRSHRSHRRIADGCSPRNIGRSLVLESARISAQRGLVDTIVNTGGNSCKKFEPPVARSRIIFVAVPSSSLPPSERLCFSSKRLTSFFVRQIWSG